MKVGIVCDNYKVKKFKEELIKNNLIIIFEGDFDIKNKLTLIKILCEKFQIDIIRNICTICEISFKQSN